MIRRLARLSRGDIVAEDGPAVDPTALRLAARYHPRDFDAAILTRAFCSALKRASSTSAALVRNICWRTEPQPRFYTDRTDSVPGLLKLLFGFANFCLGGFEVALRRSRRTGSRISTTMQRLSCTSVSEAFRPGAV